MEVPIGSMLLRKGSEADWLPNRKIVAPVRLEKALKAKHGAEPWDNAYAVLELSQVATTARLLKRGGDGCR